VSPAAPGAHTAPRSPTLDEALVALRTLPYGGMDDASVSLRLPAAVQATISPVISALRWSTAMFGTVYAAARAEGGEIWIVCTLAVVLFLTTWRTVRPLRLGSRRTLDRVLARTDGVLVGAAVGLSGALGSPFAPSAIAIAAIAAFGWGLRAGFDTLALTLVAMALAHLAGPMSSDGVSVLGVAVLAAFPAAVVLTSGVRSRLLTEELRRERLAGQLDQLIETNDLLHLLNQAARTLPMSLDLHEALEDAREQLRDAFDASVVCLLVHDEITQEWVPRIAEGCALAPSIGLDELPEPLRHAASAATALVDRHLEPDAQRLASTSKSGMYSAIRARGRTVGVLGIEHPDVRRYGDREVRLLEALGDVLAITVDNATSFQRLRTLGADEERSRIARDLHDRLGQWLAYISLELERIIGAPEAPTDELEKLHDDVQTAIGELRETLRQLRIGVTAERSFASVATELVERFNKRRGATATFVAHTGERLAPRIENECMRILQESLSNVVKHAGARQVHIDWDVRDGVGVLTVRDDGRGFETGRSVRDSAYGLVGMRERAALIGARIEILSRPGQGTVVRLSTDGRAREPLDVHPPHPDDADLVVDLSDGATTDRATTDGATTDGATTDRVTSDGSGSSAPTPRTVDAPTPEPSTPGASS